jgi:hypothetical protein
MMTKRTRAGWCYFSDNGACLACARPLV